MARKKRVKKIKVEIVEEVEIQKDNDGINNIHHNIKTEELDIKEEPYNPEDDTVPNQCYICLKAFSTKGNLKTHMQKHVDDQYEPEVSYKRNTRSGGVYIPAFYIEEKPYSCKICSKSYLTKESLIAHVRGKHEGCPKQFHKNTKNEMLTCNICHKTCSNIYTLRAHNIKHTGRKTFFCYACNEEFKWKLQLKLHKRICHSKKHKTSLKSFPCDICPKIFDQIDLLTKHSKIHDKQINDNNNNVPKKNEFIKVIPKTSTPAYKCRICYKRFNTTVKLDEHALLHKKKKRYACDICHKGFNNNILLTMHVGLHAKNVPLKNNVAAVPEKPRAVYIPANAKLYECEVCHKRFLLRTALRVHLQQEHPIEITFECNICHERFAQVESLLAHSCGEPLYLP